LYQVGKENAELALTLVGYDEELKVYQPRPAHQVKCVHFILLIHSLLVILSEQDQQIIHAVIELYVAIIHTKFSIYLLSEPEFPFLWYCFPTVVDFCCRLLWNMFLVQHLFAKTLTLQRRYAHLCRSTYLDCLNV